LEPKKQEKGGTQNRTQKVLPLVPQTHRAQGGEEIATKGALRQAWSSQTYSQHPCRRIPSLKPRRH